MCVVMRGFLKCFYWYRNLWDEFLFWGVLDYIDTMYSNIDELTVEVKDVEWMQSWWTSNIEIIKDLKLASWFALQKKIIKFTEVTKNPRDNFIYDIYFFGWWEVFAESRGFHWWWNYFFRYIWALHMKKIVFLWWIETPHDFFQKMLYKYLLPKADKIICREEHSYNVARYYNNNTQLYTDFVIPLVDKYKQYVQQHNMQTLTSHDPYDIHKLSQLFWKKYILINMIGSMSNDLSYELIQKFVALYEGYTLVYVSCGTDDKWREDKYYAKWLQWIYPDVKIYDWEKHSIIQTLSLFQYATAGIWCRLHFLLLLQELQIDRYALVYAEKIKKLVKSTITL